MKKIRVTYTLVVELFPILKDRSEAEVQSIEVVLDDPASFVAMDGSNVTIATEWVEVDE